MTVFRSLIAVLVLTTCALHAQPWLNETKPLDVTMGDYEYPHPVSSFSLTIEGQEVRMAYMDVAPSADKNRPASANPDEAQTVVLFHGKNFFGAYWRDTIRALSDAGFRVIVPDQLGFGKSSKPAVSYSFTSSRRIRGSCSNISKYRKPPL